MRARRLRAPLAPLGRMIRRARRELAVLIALTGITGGVWSFVEIVEEVTEGEFRPVDQKILLAMRESEDVSDPLGPLWFEEVVRDVTTFGGVTAIVLVTGAVAGYLALSRRRRAALLIVAAAASGFGMVALLKDAFGRPRPELVPHGAHVTSLSFPSGHATMAAVVYLTLGALLARVSPHPTAKLYALAVASFMTLTVGVSRVYLGVHWPSDVLAGWTLGAVWALLAWIVALLLQRRGTVEHPEAASPAPG